MPDTALGRHSRDCAIEALRRHIPPDGSVLEIGSGIGFMLLAMRKALPAATITGSDFDNEVAARLSRHLSSYIPTMHLDITQWALPSDSFDAVVALNVFERIERDADAALQIMRILKPGGVLVIEVSAKPPLHDGCDAGPTRVHHYTRRSLRVLLEGAGLRVVEQSAVGFLACPAFWLTKTLNRLRFGGEAKEASARHAPRNVDSSVVRWSLKAERALRAVTSLPIGIRHTAIAVKQGPMSEDLATRK